MTYFVYIMASKRNGTLYIGLMNNLARRAYEHKNDLIDGFTKRYGVHLLVYYETFPGIGVAIAREKSLKNWKRKWKLRLIEEAHPDWKDLFGELH